MRMRSVLIAAALTSLAPTSVAAQYAAGLRAPTGISDGLGVAFGMGCVFAASQRLASGLNAEMSEGSVGLTREDALPDDLAAFMPAADANSTILRFETPEGNIWTLYDER